MPTCEYLVVGSHFVMKLRLTINKLAVLLLLLDYYMELCSAREGTLEKIPLLPSLPMIYVNHRYRSAVRA